MRKTMLSALVIGASVFTVSAFAQANLGGAARVGAGAHVGAAAPSAMHTVGQATAQTVQTLHRTDSHVKHRARRAVEKTRSTVNDHANANANAGGTIGAGAGDSHAGANANVDTGAGLDTAATAGKAGDMGQASAATCAMPRIRRSSPPTARPARSATRCGRPPPGNRSVLA
jgi:hypothetical protein